jgi:hypothetical protein
MYIEKKRKEEKFWRRQYLGSNFTPNRQPDFIFLLDEIRLLENKTNKKQVTKESLFNPRIQCNCKIGGTVW